MRIESIRLKNFKAFQNVHLTAIPPFMVVVGANGTGKSTLFDVFGFLHDCLQSNVRQALSARGRFREVLSRGANDETILIEIQYRIDILGRTRLVTYTLELAEMNGNPFVKKESLRYKRGRYGAPYYFLNFQNGEGWAITNEEDFQRRDEELEREYTKLGSPDILAIKGLGQFDRFKAANAFRQLIEAWHVSDFHIDAARGRKEITGESEHLSESGDNLPRVAQFLFEQHPTLFADILQVMSARVPGIDGIQPVITEDGYLTLRFRDGAFLTPFLDRYVSDGTIKMFAYLVLLYDPYPHPLLCVEEPENQLYPKLMAELAEEFRLYANRGGQVLVSTHSPDFLNACELEEVVWLVKDGGYTTIRRASDDEQVTTYMADGDVMGNLWKQGFFLRSRPLVAELVFLLEEQSAQAMLEGILPRMNIETQLVRYVVFDGKQDLNKNVTRKIRGYRKPGARFIVIRDLDSEPDCVALKERLSQMCVEAGRPDTVIRIFCKELEAIYLADLAAVELGLGIQSLATRQGERKYRNPDNISSPSNDIKLLTGGRYQKVSGSRAIGRHLDINNLRSASFRALIAGVKRSCIGLNL